MTASQARGLRASRITNALPARLLLFARATSLNRAPGSNVMAKGQMRSNKEKKKPKAERNIEKGGR